MKLILNLIANHLMLFSILLLFLWFIIKINLNSVEKWLTKIFD